MCLYCMSMCSCTYVVASWSIPVSLLLSSLQSSPHLPRKAGLPSDIKGSVMRNRRSIFAKPRELSEAECELTPAHIFDCLVAVWLSCVHTLTYIRTY